MVFLSKGSNKPRSYVQVRVKKDFVEVLGIRPRWNWSRKIKDSQKKKYLISFNVSLLNLYVYLFKKKTCMFMFNSKYSKEDSILSLQMMTSFLSLITYPP